MFISFSKTIARFGGFRLGVGMRVNKKNAIWVSLIVMFVAMFKAMWYMMILCGWLIYAMFYGMYWCIKKIVGASSKKQKSTQPKVTYSEVSQNTTPNNTNNEEKDDTPIMTNSPENNQNNNSGNKSPKNKSAIVRWVVGGFFAMFALVNGFHYSSLFLLLSAFLMFPLSFVEDFLKKINVKTVVAIILSVVLFFVGVLTSPPSDSVDDPSDDTNQSQTNDDNNNGGTTNGNGSNETTPTDKYSNLKEFIVEYNKLSKTDITSTVEIDIQSPEYYRTEFRLNAYKNAPAYKANLGNNTIEIINSNYDGIFGSDLRIYVIVDTLEEATEVFETFCKACDPDITQTDFDNFYRYNALDKEYGCSITIGGISGFVNKKADGFDIMLDAKPDYFAD